MCVHAIYVYVPHEVKKLRTIGKMTSQIMKWTDVTIQMGSG